MMTDEEINFHIDTIERLLHVNMLQEAQEIVSKLPDTKEVNKRVKKAFEGGKIEPKK